MTRPDSKACVNRNDRAATRLAKPAAVRPPHIGAGQAFVVPERPLPRETHPHRESNEESPGRQVSLAQSGGDRCAASAFCPSVLPAENITKPICSRKNAPTPRRRLRSPFPRPFVLRRDRHKETHKPEVNPPCPITASPIRERTTGDLDPRRNRNVTSRKPFCLTQRVKQQA